jgi:acyl-CoA thioester hydrolase
MAFIYCARVRFVDTDASLRIHFTSMLRHFEAAEQEFLRSLGLQFQEMNETGVGFPRVHAECDYTDAVRYDDLLEITVSVERIGRTSYTLTYAAAVEGRPVAHGRITVVAVDLKTQKATPLPEVLAWKFGEAAKSTG